MRGAAAGKGDAKRTDWPQGKTGRRDGPSGNRRVLARTRNRLATGNRGTGTRLPWGTLPLRHRLLGLTNSSSATEAGEDKTMHTKRNRTASLCSLERVVRPAPTERLNGNQPRLRRGNDGRCRRKGLTNRADDVPEGLTHWNKRSGLNEDRRATVNGNARATRQQRTKDSGPNGLKLSDRGWREEA